MSPSRFFSVVALLASFAAVTVVRAQTPSRLAETPSPLAGIWKVNMAKSTYDPATLAPKSGMVTYKVTGDRINAVIDGVDSQGRKTHSEYAARFDGKTYPGKFLIDGKPNPDQDGVAWKMLDNRTYEITSMLKGKALVTSHIVIAADGKSRTNTTTGKNAKGQAISNKVTYDKQ